MLRHGTFRDRTLAQGTRAPESAPSRADGALESAGEHVQHVPTPIYISHRTRLILLAAIVAAVIWLFALAPSVPRLLVLGSVGALILSFPVRLLDRWMPRGLAILTVMGSTVAAVVVGLILIIPFAINEITDAVAQLPGIADTLETCCGTCGAGAGSTRTRTG